VRQVIMGFCANDAERAESRVEALFATDYRKPFWT